MSKADKITIVRGGHTVPSVAKETAQLACSDERLTGRLFRKFFRPGVWLGLVVIIEQGFCSIANFLTGMLVARTCSKEEYGFYVLGFTLLMLTVNVQGGICGTPFTVFSPSLNDRDRRAYLGNTLILHLVISVLAAIGFIVAAFVVSAIMPTDALASVLFALAAVSVFMLLRDFMRYVLLAQFHVWASLFMGLAVNFATVVMLFWAYKGAWLTAPIAYIILGASAGLPALGVLWSERKQITVTRKRLKEHLRQNCHFGKWLVGQIVVMFFAIRMYPWLLLFFKGSAATGVYGACTGLAAMVNPLFLGAKRYLGPRTAHAACKGGGHVRREVYLGMALLVGPLFVIFLGTLFFGEWAIVAIYGRKYAGAGAIFSICTFAAIIAIAHGIVSTGINALRRPDIAFRAQLVGLAVTVTLGLFLAYKLGPLGAALAVCIARAFATGYQLIGFHSLTVPADKCNNSISS